ncbi:DUF6843 domain-containing protein [Rossellomorea sp. NRS-1567]|uniref:DUF6843 domain-containing protein n=1 Tax=Rossellomorea sp. NRS-1567 TaxID=3233901 RepID=UPI003D29DFC1
MVLIFLLLVGGCSSQGKTNHIYLIPEGYEGSVTVFFNIPDAPGLKKEGEFSVIPIHKTEIEALHQTDYATYGYALTSREETYTPEAPTYEVNNQYYYVDAEGERTRIDDYCIHGMGDHGGSTGASGKEITYVYFQVTNSECGEDFFLHGNESYTIQKNEAQSKWINQYAD